MPIPGTDIETTAEFAGRMIRDAAAENERLRELLAIARQGLRTGLVNARNHFGPGSDIDFALSGALCRSDPDATAAEVREPPKRCDCELRNRQWNPNTKTCEFCRRRYAD